ncbi:MAG: hypothetical protein QOK21_2207 [Solirubrobacteraceae bacterium]|nr:hypothetical protein [Solirubrobacteraceae bacterium]
MSDPGGGYGWRAGPYMPRHRGGVLGLGRLAERATPADLQPLGIMLLPQPLEEFWLRERAEDLLTAPAVYAADPARISYRALGRLPDTLMTGLAAGQARRMRFPGVPRAILVFHPLQYPLARSMIADNPDAQLWYADWSPDVESPHRPRVQRRIADFDTMAAMRADWRFDASAPAGGVSARECNRELWERLEDLGVESGRLGSERPGVIRAARAGGASSPS